MTRVGRAPGGCGIGLVGVLLAFAPIHVQAGTACEAWRTEGAPRAEQCASERLAAVTRDVLPWTVSRLSELGDPAVPTLTIALRSDRVPARAAAAEALGRIARRSKQPGPILDALAPLVDDPELTIRQVVVISIMGVPHETPLSKAALARAKRDPDRLIRAMFDLRKQELRRRGSPGGDAEEPDTGIDWYWAVGLGCAVVGGLATLIVRKRRVNR